jgi:DNA-binding ferritin-like protein
VELRSHATQVSWDVQGHDVCLLQVLCTVILTALDVYSDLVAERLAVLGKVAAEHGPHGGHAGEAASVSRRQSGR